MSIRVHHRKSIRLKGYDYSQAGLYFITICCQDRIHRFGQVENNAIILNEFGIVAYNEWINTPDIRKNIKLEEFIIMPNHLNCIIRIIERGESHSPGIMPMKNYIRPITRSISNYILAVIHTMPNRIRRLKRPMPNRIRPEISN